MKKIDIEDFITQSLEEESFEDILEVFDLTPSEVFWILYQEGMIDDLVLESRCSPRQ